MTRVFLRNGEAMRLRVCEPPFDDGHAGLCWWRDVADDLMAGQLRPWLHTPYFLGYLGQELAGYLSLWTPTDRRDVGLVEFVWTAEPDRRKGIASALLGRLVADFSEAGGQALYLCTTNPHAGHLYESHGFRYLVGDGMRRLAPEAADFDRKYLGHTGAATTRATTWADLPRAAVLYNHAEPRWFLKDPLSDSYRDTRYESHFVKVFRRLEGGRGGSWVLESPEGRVVGMATVERRGTHADQHTARLSLRAAPAYLGQGSELIEAAVAGSAALGIRILDVDVADGDGDQKQLLETSGFSIEARRPDRLWIDGAHQDLVVFARHVPEAAAAPFAEGDYYGGRKGWQHERLAELGRGGSP